LDILSDPSLAVAQISDPFIEPPSASQTTSPFASDTTPLVPPAHTSIDSQYPASTSTLTTTTTTTTTTTAGMEDVDDLGDRKQEVSILLGETYEEQNLHAYIHGNGSFSEPSSDHSTPVRTPTPSTTSSNSETHHVEIPVLTSFQDLTRSHSINGELDDDNDAGDADDNLDHNGNDEQHNDDGSVSSLQIPPRKRRRRSSVISTSPQEYSSGDPSAQRKPAMTTYYEDFDTIDWIRDNLLDLRQRDDLEETIRVCCCVLLLRRACNNSHVCSASAGDLSV
jgi:hypothetical protein